MLNNDISNTESFKFAFRVEDSLLLPEKKSLFKAKRYVVNKNVVKYIQTIYRKTPYTLCLVSRYDQVYFENMGLFNNVPFSGYYKQGIYDVYTSLFSGEYDYYVDIDSNRRSLVQSGYALDLPDLSLLLRKK